MSRLRDDDCGKVEGIQKKQKMTDNASITSSEFQECLTKSLEVRGKTFKLAKSKLEQIKNAFSTNEFWKLAEDCQKGNLTADAFITKTEELNFFSDGDNDEDVDMENAETVADKGEEFQNGQEVLEFVTKNCNVENITRVRLSSHIAIFVLNNLMNLTNDETNKVKEFSWNSEKGSEVSIYGTDGVTSVTIMPTITKQKAMDLLIRDKLLSLDKATIEKVLKRKTEEILKGNGDESNKKLLSYVETTPAETREIWNDAVPIDKRKVIVVAGESGSGKTVYSCLAQREYTKSTVLYAVASAPSLIGDKKKNSTNLLSMSCLIS